MRKTTLMCILFSILFGASPSLARPTVDWAGKPRINLSCGSKIAAWISNDGKISGRTNRGNWRGSDGACLTPSQRSFARSY